MTILGLHHAQITIATVDEAAARAFYVDFLGLTEIQKPDSLRGRGGFWLRAGDAVVHVGVEEGVDRAATKAHLAYRVDDLSAASPRRAASPFPATSALSSAIPLATGSR